MGKLDLYQASGLSTSTALYIKNDDVSLTTTDIITGLHSELSSYNSMGLSYGGEFICHGKNMNYAVSGYSNGNDPSSTTNYGGYFNTENGKFNNSVYGHAYGVPSPNSGLTINNTGVKGSADGVSSTNGIIQNIGVDCYAWNGNIDWAVHAKAQPNGAPNPFPYFLSGALPNLAGLFDGDVWIAGNFGYSSDARIKTDVHSLDSSISKIMHLNPVSFNFDTAAFPQLSLARGPQMGFIAQAVRNIFPYLVKKYITPPVFDTNGVMIYDTLQINTLNYLELIPLAIAGIKEQQHTITKQQNTLDSLKTVIAAMNLHLSPNGQNEKSTGNNNDTTQNGKQNNYQIVELKNEHAIILNQNDPNPFAEETFISYYLPETVMEAKIMFYENSGNIIKTVELIGNGNGTLHVYASNLSSGLYTYSLVADGKTIDTKKMVCAKR